MGDASAQVCIRASDWKFLGLGWFWLQPKAEKVVDRTELTSRARAAKSKPLRRVEVEEVKADETVQISPAMAVVFNPAVTQRFYPRDADEWQGMRVDIAAAPPCKTSDDCGLARACIDGACAACSEDSQCGRGEACVLDNCIPETQVECRTRKDCGQDAKCVMTGYSSDPRGNSATHSRCGWPSKDVAAPVIQEQGEPDKRVNPSPHADLMSQAVEALNAPAPSRQTN